MSRESDSSPGAGACVVRASGLVASGLLVMAVEGWAMLGHKALHQQKSTFLILSYSILLHLIPLILGVRRE